MVRFADPVEPSNVVDGPLPGEEEYTSTSLGSDTASTTDSGYYMAVDSQSIPPGVSRLITPYLPGHPNSLVCLQLTYAVYGQGAERIQVVAQDVGNRPLFTLERYGRSWRTFGINMTVHQDVRFSIFRVARIADMFDDSNLLLFRPPFPSTQFFIEAYTNGKPGVIAIDDFTYSFDPCR
ncbi:hypothetical protein V5799_033619 [Amblyomma americanum]|uniref:MAM domain-containing protein n=1 Tax=Amblyomma americanum TaxID=6943 RepID=A0AAQ4DMT6_AMBAM